MNILIFGGFGFIGSRLVSNLQLEGHTIYIIDREGSLHQARLSEFHLISKKLGMNEIFQEYEFDAVIYLASTLLPATVVSSINLRQSLGEDFITALDALYSAREAGVKKFLFASSGGSIYDDKIIHRPFSESDTLRAKNAYGANKISIEQHMRVLSAADFRAISVRMSNPYHHIQDKKKSQGIIPIFIRNVIERKPITIYGDGLNIRDYIHLDDVARAFSQLVQYKGSIEAINIGSGKAHTILDIIQKIEAAAEISPKIYFKAAREVDKRYAVVDNTLAGIELDWRPSISLSTGITLCYKHILSEYQLQES